MVSSSRTVIIAGLVLTLCCQVDASEIIETTDYHAGEAKVTTEGSWLALQKSDDGWRLVSVKPKFKRVDDAVLGPMEGINVSVNLPSSRILLMDGSLKPGPVVSATKGISHKLNIPLEIATIFQTNYATRHTISPAPLLSNSGVNPHPVTLSFNALHALRIFFPALP